MARADLLAANLLSASLPLSLSLILMVVASILRRLSGGVVRMNMSVKASRNGNLALMAAKSWSDMYKGLPRPGSLHATALWWEVSSEMRSEALSWASCSSEGERDKGRPE
jgi:hypothetical protein